MERGMMGGFRVPLITYRTLLYPPPNSIRKQARLISVHSLHTTARVVLVFCAQFFVLLADYSHEIDSIMQKYLFKSSFNLLCIAPSIFVVSVIFFPSLIVYFMFSMWILFTTEQWPLNSHQVKSQILLMASGHHWPLSCPHPQPHVTPRGPLLLHSGHTGLTSIPKMCYSVLRLLTQALPASLIGNLSFRYCSQLLPQRDIPWSLSLKGSLIALSPSPHNIYYNV